MLAVAPSATRQWLLHRYRNLFDVLKNGEYRFFRITDGNGWKTATQPLRETFGYNDYLFNLALLEKGILEHLLE